MYFLIDWEMTEWIELSLKLAKLPEKYSRLTYSVQKVTFTNPNLTKKVTWSNPILTNIEPVIISSDPTVTYKVTYSDLQWPTVTLRWPILTLHTSSYLYLPHLAHN